MNRGDVFSDGSGSIRLKSNSTAAACGQNYGRHCTHKFSGDVTASKANSCRHWWPLYCRTLPLPCLFHLVQTDMKASSRSFCRVFRRGSCHLNHKTTMTFKYCAHICHNVPSYHINCSLCQPTCPVTAQCPHPC